MAVTLERFVQAAVAADASVRRRITVPAHAVSGVALQHDQAACIRFFQNADMIRLSVLLPVKENNVAALGRILPGRTVQPVSLQGAHPAAAARLLREGALRHPGVMQAEGNVHGAPVGVFRTVPAAVAGIPLLLAVSVNDKIRRAFQVAQLGAGNGEQILRPAFAQPDVRKRRFPFLPCFRRMHGAGKRLVRHGGRAACIRNGQTDIQRRYVSRPHGGNAKLFFRPVRFLQQRCAALVDSHTVRHRGHAALTAQCERHLVAAEAGTRPGVDRRPQFSGADHQPALGRDGFFSAHRRQPDGIQAGGRKCITEGGAFRRKLLPRHGGPIRFCDRENQLFGILRRKAPFPCLTGPQGFRALQGVDLHRGFFRLLLSIRFFPGRLRRLRRRFRDGRLFHRRFGCFRRFSRFLRRVPVFGLSRLRRFLRARLVLFLLFRGRYRRFRQRLGIAAFGMGMLGQRAAQHRGVAALAMGVFLALFLPAIQYLLKAGIGMKVRLHAALSRRRSGNGGLDQLRRHGQRHHRGQSRHGGIQPAAARSQPKAFLDISLQIALFPVHRFSPSIQRPPGAAQSIRPKPFSGQTRMTIWPTVSFSLMKPITELRLSTEVER